MPGPSGRSTPADILVDKSVMIVLVSVKLESGAGSDGESVKPGERVAGPPCTGQPLSLTLG